MRPPLAWTWCRWFASTGGATRLYASVFRGFGDGGGGTAHARRPSALMPVDLLSPIDGRGADAPA
ncbi:MAG: hypothetical protein WCI75_21145, partial [candidate division NC10 bacterium]